MGGLLVWRSGRDTVHCLPHAERVNGAVEWLYLHDAVERGFTLCRAGCFDERGRRRPGTLWGQTHFLFDVARVDRYLDAIS